MTQESRCEAMRVEKMKLYERRSMHMRHAESLAVGEVSHLWSHLSLNREGRWSTTDDFATSFLQFFLFSTAFWDLAKSRLGHSLMLSSHLFLCLPCLFHPFTVPCKMVCPDLMNERHDHTTTVCVSLRWSGGLRVVRLPAGSWHGLPRWWHGLCMRCVVSFGSTSFPCLVLKWGEMRWRSLRSYTLALSRIHLGHIWWPWIINRCL